MKQRFYHITGLDNDGLPEIEWRQKLLQVVTGYAITVDLPVLPQIRQRKIVIDQPVRNVNELRTRIRQLLPVAGYLDDITLCVTVNDEIKLIGEGETLLQTGDHVKFVPQIAGG